MCVFVPALPWTPFPQSGESNLVAQRSFCLCHFRAHAHRKCDHCLCAMAGHFTSLEGHERSTDGSVVHLGTLICVNIQAFFKKKKKTTHVILGNPVVVVMFMNDIMSIISFWLVWWFPECYTLILWNHSQWWTRNVRKVQPWFFFFAFPLFCFYGSGNRSFITAVCVLSSFAEALHNLWSRFQNVSELLHQK